MASNDDYSSTTRAHAPEASLTPFSSRLSWGWTLFSESRWATSGRLILKSLSLYYHSNLKCLTTSLHSCQSHDVKAEHTQDDIVNLNTAAADVSTLSTDVKTSIVTQQLVNGSCKNCCWSIYCTKCFNNIKCPIHCLKLHVNERGSMTSWQW